MTRKKMNQICQILNIEIKTISKVLPKNSKERPYLLFHMSVCSLTKNFDDFNILVSELKVTFDILFITESRIKIDSSIPNLHLNSNSIEHTPT